MIQHEYMTMKLNNGDNIICVVVSDNDDVFTIMYPIQMKTARIETEGKQKEILTGTPWCSFTNDNIFEIYKQDVILLKPLNDSTIKYYKNLVDTYIPSADGTIEQIPDVEFLKECSDEFFFIEGNKTIN